MSKSMHEGVATWCDACSCAAEPRWRAMTDPDAPTPTDRPLRLAVLQHVHFEGPAAIADWAHRAGHELHLSGRDRGDRLPPEEGIDGLVVLGGPMSVNDGDRYPWIAHERALIRRTIDAEKPVLGICLGAQLIASALGAAVYPGVKEIGWFPVRRADPADASAAPALPERFTPLHWHGDTFELPPGAERLAETDAVPNQAFRIGHHVLGLQFHLEATPASLEQLVAHAGGEIGDGPFEQPAAAIRAAAAHSPDLHAILDPLLDRWAAGAAFSESPSRP